MTAEQQSTQSTACDTCSVSRQAKIIRRGIDAFNRRDMSVLAAISTEDVEIRPAAQTAVEGSAVYRGSRAWSSYFSFIGEIWEDWRVEDAKLRDARDGRLVAITLMSGRGVRSGGSVERTFGLVFSFRDDQIKRLDGYDDPDAALLAAGLEPDLS
jgi:ketosteroid isomerase-like protein